MAIFKILQVLLSESEICFVVINAIFAMIFYILRHKINVPASTLFIKGYSVIHINIWGEELNLPIDRSSNSKNCTTLITLKIRVFIYTFKHIMFPVLII